MNTTFEGRTETGKDEWLTPRYITDALAPFDLDPCSPINRPWPTAARHLTIRDDGLTSPWSGFVWCNPPYGAQTAKWLERMALHNHGIALIFARTETRMFFEHIWQKADSLLFLKGRLTFHNVDGTPGDNSAGAPSVLVGYGTEATRRLREALRSGAISGALMSNDSKN